jgi:hypothetical protein
VPRFQVLKSLGAGTEREHVFLEVVDAANPADDMVNRKWVYATCINLHVDSTVDDNRRRRWHPSSSFCSLNLTHRSWDSGAPVQNLGTLHAGHPCCHFEDGKSVSSRWTQDPKRRRPDDCWVAQQNRQTGGQEQD